MKKFLILAASVFLLCSAVTGCGKTRTAETENSSEIVAVDFSDFEKNRIELKNIYEAVKTAYESESAEADADIEAKMSAAADVLNKFGNIKQEEFDSPEALNSANKDVLDSIAVLDKAAEKLNAPKSVISYEQVSENYNTMKELYGKLSAEDPASQSSETKDALEEAKALISQTGELTDESFKTQKELTSFNMYVEETIIKLSAAETK